MDYIQHYILAHAGTIVPIRYTRMAALYTLMLAAENRLVIDHGHFTISPCVYLCLIGDPNSKKTTAMTGARRITKLAFPDYPVGPSVCSREDIVKNMSRDYNMRSYFKDGERIEYSPLALFVNEFENFLSFNPQHMIAFLTDIYEVPYFDSGTIKRGLEPIHNPVLNLMACTVADFVSDMLRVRTIGRGFLRRMIFIMETRNTGRQPFPILTPESIASQGWCVEHLRKVAKLSGVFTWEPDARAFFVEWDKGNIQKDPLFDGYYASKDILAQKFAMLLALAQPEPKLVITLDLLKVAIALLESNEDSLPFLSVCAGQNDLFRIQQRLIEALEARGGWMLEKVFHRLANLDLQEHQYKGVLDALKLTEQVFVAPLMIRGTQKDVVMTPAKWHEVSAQIDERLKAGLGEPTYEVA